ncbi:glycosyltransferase family 4 protein [Celerinatantimonas yamalensis]|uniref:Glycosyltransferase family 4 protein n=1 Tax=Celerinatantimonas yamalensis TaxID=559956 RepID=A0ABW9G4D4_9GAMM
MNILDTENIEAQEHDINVLHIVSGDLSGGAARGAYWLHQALKELGVKSHILNTSSKDLNDNSVCSISNTKWKRVKSILRSFLDRILLSFYRKRSGTIFSCGVVGFDITKTDMYKNADIIQLHWVNDGFLNAKILQKINKPIVWTLRDMWPITGGCHYSLDCELYTTGCGACPQLASSFPFDLSYFLYRRKLKYFPNTVHVVGISKWMTDVAKKSKIFSGCTYETISNNVNCSYFKFLDKEKSRHLLGINTSKKIVLCGATNINDFYKGFSFFLESLKYLNADDVFLCFFGKIDQDIIKKTGFEFHEFGYLHDNIALNIVYSIADVFVAPSIQEAFGKTLVESMSSGTPVVCFDATGPIDIVDHKVNGYKAKAFSSEDLACGINWVLNASTCEFEALRVDGREKSLSCFDTNVIAKKYLTTYMNLLTPSSNR